MEPAGGRARDLRASRRPSSVVSGVLRTAVLAGVARVRPGLSADVALLVVPPETAVLDCVHLTLLTYCGHAITSAKFVNLWQKTTA